MKIPIGTSVRIWNTNVLGNPFTEGMARIVEHVKEGRYMVRFRNGDIVLRSVCADRNKSAIAKAVAKLASKNRKNIKP